MADPQVIYPSGDVPWHFPLVITDDSTINRPRLLDRRYSADPIDFLGVSVNCRRFLVSAAAKAACHCSSEVSDIYESRWRVASMSCATSARTSSGVQCRISIGLWMLSNSAINPNTLRGRADDVTVVSGVMRFPS